MADKTGCGKDKIYNALYSKNIEETKYVLENCKVPDEYLNPICQGKGLCKPIIIASAKNLPESVELLAEAGASINVNGGGTSGDTPLIYALMYENRKLVKFLIQKGADVNQANNFGVTPFLGVCATNDIELVDLFMRSGADVNYGGAFPDPLAQKKGVVTGVTPLMLAAEKQNVALVELLLESQADSMRKDSLGRTARDYTTNKDIMQLLDNHGN